MLVRWIIMTVRKIALLRTGQAAIRRSRVRSAISAILFIFTLLGILVGCGRAVLGAAAQPSTVRIEEVAEDEFEPEGYEESIDFTGVEVEQGFTPVADVGRYVLRKSMSEGSSSDPNDLYGQLKGSEGFQFAIDEETGGDVKPSLRYTDGRWGDTAIDAIVTIEEWTYTERSGGWDSWWEAQDVDEFQPGVYVAKNYRSQSDDGQGYQNFNFYTVGIDTMTVSVAWVYHGTTNPIAVKGHMTCIDLDALQQFAFSGSITGGRIVENNDHLSLIDEGTTVASTSSPLSLDFTEAPDEYRKGLVEVFYDTTDEGLPGEPANLHFTTSWNAGNGNTAQSFFAMTSDFLTLPQPEEDITGESMLVKYAEPSEDVTEGETVTWTLSYQAHEGGVNCRLGYHYTALSLIDELPAELTYVEGSAKLFDESGSELTGAGTVTFTPVEGSSEGGELRFDFDPSFLSNMPMQGEHYRLVFDTVLTTLPDIFDFTVTNTGTALINASGELTSSAEIVPAFDNPPSILKTADRYTVAPGETITYRIQITPMGFSRIFHQARLVDTGLPEGVIIDRDSLVVEGIPFDMESWQDDRPAHELEIPLGDFVGPSTVVITYQAHIPEDLPVGEELTNTAEFLSDDLDEVIRDDTTVVVEQEEPEPIPDTQPEEPEPTTQDSALPTISKQASTDLVEAGDRVTYTIDIDTTGALEDTMLEDTGLPAGCTIVSDSITTEVDGANVQPKTEIEGQHLTMDLGHLDAASHVSITYDVSTDPTTIQAGDMTNTASLSSTSLDDAVHDAVTVSVMEQSQPPREKHAQIIKTASCDTVSAGDLLTYHITAVAQDDVSDVTLSDSGLPEGTTIVQESWQADINGEPHDVEPAWDENSFTLEIGDLAVNDVVDISYSVMVDKVEGETIHNVATLASPDITSVSDMVDVTVSEPDDGEPAALPAASDDADDTPTFSSAEKLAETGDSTAGPVLAVTIASAIVVGVLLITWYARQQHQETGGWGIRRRPD